MSKMANAFAALGFGASIVGMSPPAVAGSDEEGNFQVRALATVVDPDTDATVKAGGS